MGQWYCYVANQRYGPVGQEIMRDWICQGRVTASTLVWTEGMSGWTAAGLVPEFSSVGGQSSAPIDPLMAVPPPAGGTGGKTPNYQLTAQARGLLKGRWGVPILTCLILMFLNGMIGSVPYVGWLGQLILCGALELGLIIFMLNLSRGAEAKVDLLFKGFNNFGKTIGLYILRSMFIGLWALLASVPGIIASILLIPWSSLPAPQVNDAEEVTFASGSEDALLNAVSGVDIAILFVAFLPVLVVPTIKTLSYYLSFYILADNPRIDCLEAITKSRIMMNGSKWKLFMLGLRFIPWYFLCILTLFIGFLWLVPYVSLSYARFYEDMLARKEAAEEPLIDIPA